MRNKKQSKWQQSIALLLGFSILCFVLVIFLHFIAEYHQLDAVQSHDISNNKDPLMPEPIPSDQLQPSDTEKPKEIEKIDNLLVLMYHHISEETDRFTSGTITPQQFEEDMLYLKSYGFETIDTQDILSYINKETPMPQKPVLVTIDDGYSSVYEHVFPVLKKYDLKAVANLIGSSVGRSTHLFEGSPIVPHFTWKQAQWMQKSGHVDIQSHSFDLHQFGEEDWNQIKGALQNTNETLEEYEERFKKDVKRNQEFIHQYLDHPVILYSYPFGLYNETTERILKEMGYLITLSIESGIANIKNDFFLLNRVNMATEKTSKEKFEDILTLLEMADTK